MRDFVPAFGGSVVVDLALATHGVTQSRRAVGSFFFFGWLTEVFKIFFPGILGCFLRFLGFLKEFCFFSSFCFRNSTCRMSTKVSSIISKISTVISRISRLFQGFLGFFGGFELELNST